MKKLMDSLDFSLAPFSLNEYRFAKNKDDFDSDYRETWLN